MNYKDKYDELENIVNTLGSLADEVTDKYYLDMINQLKFEARNELDAVEEAIYAEEQSEQRELEFEFYRGRI